jgi:hypothetical protein
MVMISRHALALASFDPFLVDVIPNALEVEA